MAEASLDDSSISHELVTKMESDEVPLSESLSDVPVEAVSFEEFTENPEQFIKLEVPDDESATFQVMVD